jgi:hypothetical protein
MRFNLRLLGQTAAGQECQAEVSVYARSQKKLVEEAKKAALTAAWHARTPPHELIPEGSQITVKNVERMR